jgi:hypothetical protein
MTYNNDCKTNYTPHEGVVSNVHGIGSDMTRLKATIIHFPWPGLFGTYTVTEETIYFNQIVGQLK